MFGFENEADAAKVTALIKESRCTGPQEIVRLYKPDYDGVVTIFPATACKC
jgi:hypothetical protein